MFARYKSSGYQQFRFPRGIAVRTCPSPPLLLYSYSNRPGRFSVRVNHGEPQALSFRDPLRSRQDEGFRTQFHDFSAL